MGESRVLAISVVAAVVGAAVIMLLIARPVDSNTGADAPRSDAEAAVTPEEVPEPTPRAAVEPRGVESPVAQPQASPPVEAPARIKIRTEPRSAPDRVDAEPPPAPVPGLDGWFEPRRVAGDIRSVDFGNEPTYPVSGWGVVALTNGSGTRGAAGQDGYVALELLDVVYGDLNGDGSDDAAITSVYSSADGDDAGLFSSVQVFGIVDGELDFWGSTWGGDRFMGGVADVAIVDGLLMVENWQSSWGSTCPEAMATRTWSAPGPGHYLEPLESWPARTVLDLGSPAECRTGELVFRGGTSSAVVAGSGDRSSTFVFDAAGGQTLRLSAQVGADSLRVRDAASGRLVGDASQGQDLTLPTDGRYHAEVMSDNASGRDLKIDLAIGDPRVLAAPTWTPRSQTHVASVEPHRQTTVHWPELTSAHANVDLDQVNAIIRTFVSDLRQAHLDGVRSCEADERAMYSLTYLPTLVSYDLVSFEFAEFSCLCESGDTYRDHVLTIDLNTGAIVSNDDLVASRAELADLLWQRVQAENQWAFEEVAIDADRPTPLVLASASLAVTPYGIEATLGSEAIEGLRGPVVTTLYYEELDGLIDSSIATRARSGAGVTLPVDETCGC